VLALLLMGMRSGELLCRKVRDVDVGADGESVLLWVDAGKTDAARRCIEAPEPVAGLLAALARGRASGEWLWASGASCGHRRLEWAIDACRRLCTAAGVPVVTPHGLRGTWATLSREAGLATHLVARELGHAGQAVTERHYLAPGADDQARTRAALRVIAGGSKVGNESSSIHSPRSAGKGEAKKTPVKTG
jgi:integrase